MSQPTTYSASCTPHYTRAASARILALLLPLCLPAADRVPAFPGAEGAGAQATGGRGGAVHKVTNLRARGPGSLTDAVAGPNRTVVFTLSGTIDLAGRNIEIAHPGITIAGQTAPGEGITIRNGSLHVTAGNVVIRHLRVRRGFVRRGDSGDAVNVKGRDISDVMLDHLSASWATDENLTLTNARNVTAQFSISSEALDYFNANQSPNRHAFGSLFGSQTPGGRMTIHHSIYAHNRLRNARTTGGDEGIPLLDFRNNIVYDSKELTSHTGNQPIHANWVNNVVKDGPSSGIEGHEKSILFTFMSGGPHRLYAAGNRIEGKPEWSADNWLAIRFQGKGRDLRAGDVRAAEPFPTPLVTTHTAAEAFEIVLDQAGATLPSRDPVDLRIVRDIRRGTGAVLNFETDLPAGARWPVCHSLPAPPDADNDGIPDAWEEQYGLDPRNPSDGALDTDRDGYTNLEEYLNNTDPAGGAGPLVFVSATVSRAWRGTGEAGELRFTRTGPADGPLVVRYSAAGRAGTVAIKSRARHAALAVRPETRERIFTARIERGPGYRVGLPAAALVSIEPGAPPPPVRLEAIDPKGGATAKEFARGRSNMEQHKKEKEQDGPKRLRKKAAKP